MSQLAWAFWVTSLVVTWTATNTTLVLPIKETPILSKPIPITLPPPPPHPGLCPTLPKGTVGTCVERCSQDSVCAADEKCCSNGCGHVCTAAVPTLPPTQPPLIACNLLCVIGLVCVVTPTGPKCVPPKLPCKLEKPGSCPLFKCPVLPPELRKCKDQCEVDNDCPGNKKCCFTCSSCLQCLDTPVPSPTCDHVKCDKAEECVLQPLLCQYSPCPHTAQCLSRDSHRGQCPTPGHDSQSVCEFQCQKDTDCSAGEKCCSSACGGTHCVCAVALNTCNNVICPNEEKCRMVFNKDTGLSVPRCIAKPPTSGNDDKCTSGPPLLLEDQSGGLTVHNRCGRVANRVDCPPGFNCVISPVDAYSICCPDQVPACYPACKPWEECSTSPILCFTTPCPPFPVCVLKPGVCELASETGPCKAAITRWYFNPVSGTCETFTYGGCKGNDNNFETLADCLSACGPPPSLCDPPCAEAETCEESVAPCLIPPCPIIHTCVDRCKQQQKVGPCRGAFPRYFYNSATQQCEQFSWGGCQPNGNNFLTQTACEELCEKDPCEQPLKVGPCRGAFPRYFYNSATQQCEHFSWGGCQPNGNNFLTQTACEEVCKKDPCEQPLKVGPCKAAFPRYFYNSAWQQCEKFWWGGCAPNGNNFLTLTACEKACKKGCKYNEQSYPVGYFVDPKDPCLHCTCLEGGKVKCAIQDCARPPCENPVSVPGQCCPQCVGCYEHGKHYDEGEAVNTDPCKPCHCFDGHLVCAIVDCFRPLCDKPVKKPGQCCAICPGCTYNEQFYPVGDFVDPNNPCQHCTCLEGGKVKCAIQDCARPPCENPVSVPGQCCPQCGGCVENGVHYEEGEAVNSDPCSPCYCIDGSLVCAIIDCISTFCERPVTEPGQCCPICPDPCLQPLDVGSCKDKGLNVKRFYFDVNSLQCKKFTYTGCGGNDNRFDAKSDCRKKCGKRFRCPNTKELGKDYCKSKNKGAKCTKRKKCSEGLSCCETHCGASCGTRCHAPISLVIGPIG